MVLESKDDYKKRTGQGSPDEADAALLAFYALTYRGKGDILVSLKDIGDQDI